MAFEVLDPGLMSLVVDRGREGVMHRGFSPSGAMDMHSYEAVCNLLFFQTSNALEVMSGLRLLALKDTTAAIAGGDLALHLDGVKVDNYSAFRIKAGQVLQFGKAKSGMRAYLAVMNGFRVPKYLGSVSVSVREGIGKVLRKGDKIEYDLCQTVAFARYKSEYIACREKLDNPITLRIYPTYQHAMFSSESKERFFNSTFKLSPKSGRMAAVLEGVRILAPTLSLYSEPNALGAVQVMGDGSVAILLCERQSIGGYPRIGTVHRDDCYLLAQAPFGASIRFELLEFNAPNGTILL